MVTALDMPVVNTSPFEIIAEPMPGGSFRVRLAGEFDMSVGDALSEALVNAARQPGVTAVVVDLRRTRFLDSHAVAGLVAGYEAAARAGRHFTAVNAQGLVKDVLDITGLSEVLLDRDHPATPADPAS
jgi:anti-anti-sigma factor